MKLQQERLRYQKSVSCVISTKRCLLRSQINHSQLPDQDLEVVEWRYLQFEVEL